MTYEIDAANVSKLTALLHRMPVGVRVEDGERALTIWASEMTRGGARRITSVRLEKRPSDGGEG